MVEVQQANVVNPDDITDEIELWEYLKIYTADAADVRRAKQASSKARKWFKRCKTSKLTQ